MKYNLYCYDYSKNIKWCGDLKTVLKLIATYKMQNYDIYPIVNGSENVAEATRVKNGKEVYNV